MLEANARYTLVGYGANEASTMTDLAAANKISCLGDPQHFLAAFAPTSRRSLTRSAPTCAPLGERGLWAMWRNSSAVLSANAFRVLVVP
jgi:predicted phage gp36 major capsid-like protein